MRTYFDCVQCFVRQALDAARLLSTDEKIHEQVLRRVLSLSSEMDFYKSPPEKGQKIHRLIREFLEDDDPYRKIKDSSNRLAMRLYPELKMKIEESSDPLETAVRFAIAGNIIDLGVNSQLDESIIYKTLEDSVKKALFPNTINYFWEIIREKSYLIGFLSNSFHMKRSRLLSGEAR